MTQNNNIWFLINHKTQWCDTAFPRRGCFSTGNKFPGKYITTEHAQLLRFLDTVTQSQYFLNYSREIDVKWQQNSVIITKLHHIHLPAIRNRNHSNFCQECLLIDERLFYIQMVNINDIDFRGFYHKCTKNNFWMLMKLFLAQLHIKGWLLRMMSSTRSLVPVHFLAAIADLECMKRQWLNFEKHKFLRRRLVPHSPNHSSQLRFCVSVFGGLGLRSLKTAPHHLFTISVPVCKFTRRLKIFCHYLLLFVGFSKQIESTSGLILTVIDWSNWFLIAERLTRILNEVNKTGGQDALLVW